MSSVTVPVALYLWYMTTNAPWFCSRPWRYTNHLLTYLLTVYSSWQSLYTAIVAVQSWWSGWYAVFNSQWSKYPCPVQHDPRLY